MKIALILPAAGASTRYQNPADGLLGSSRSKLDEDLGGRPVLQRTVELFHTRPEIDTILVVGPQDRKTFADFSLRHQDKLTLLGARLIQGGAERYDSVRAAIEQVPEHCTHIAVHDAARPGTPPALIDRVLSVGARYDAVIPAIPVSDTIKRVDNAPIEDAGADPLASILSDGADSALHRVQETLSRDGLMQVQTPQLFARELLIRAYAQNNLASTDDAALVEQLGEQVVIVQGDERNLKITRPGDTEILRAILGYTKPAQRATHKKF